MSLSKYNINRAIYEIYQLTETLLFVFLFQERTVWRVTHSSERGQNEIVKERNVWRVTHSGEKGENERVKLRLHG